MKIFSFSMADSLKDILNDVKSFNRRRLEHLLKLYYYREDTQDFNSWIASVASSPDQIDLLKGPHKFPSKEKLLQAMWLVQEDSFYRKEQLYLTNFASHLVTDYPAKQPSKNSYAFCDEYHKWFAEYLAKEGLVPISSVSAKITELLNKYPL
jgi:hypothetical protein